MSGHDSRSASWGGSRGGSQGGFRKPSTGWSRLKPATLDPLEEIGLPSKGDSRLLNFKTQEQYYTKIVDRYMAFCASAGRGDELLRRMNALSISNTSQSQSRCQSPSRPQNSSYTVATKQERQEMTPLQPNSKQPQGLATSRWAEESVELKTGKLGRKGMGGAYAPPHRRDKPSPSQTPIPNPPPVAAQQLQPRSASSTTIPSSSSNSSSSSVSLPVVTATSINFDTSSRELSLLLMSMRKLREGLLASRRIDTFSTQVYIFIIRLSILLRAWESYHPALHHLLHNIHPRLPLSKLEVWEFGGYLVLDLACRQDDLRQAREVLCRYGLNGKVRRVLECLVRDDYIGYWRVMRSVDGHQAKLMEWRTEQTRIHALKCIGRAYLSTNKQFVEAATNAKWKDLVQEHNVGWELRGDEVVIRKPKVR